MNGSEPENPDVEFLFAWDQPKAALNLKKHGISFDEAATVFPDPLARIEHDPDHSRGEERELILGQSARKRLLVVSFVQRGQTIRIISARPATRSERHAYREKAHR